MWDKVTRAVGYAVESIPRSGRVLSIAEGTLEAITSIPDAVSRVGKVVTDVYYDVCYSYRSGKSRGMTKHKPATKAAIGLLIHLLQTKYGIGLGDAAKMLGLRKAKAKKLANCKRVKSILQNPKKMSEMVYSKKRAKKVSRKLKKGS
jgi:hypothetical protein